jgi:hypothetical protein
MLALSAILCLYPKILLALPHLIVVGVLLLAAQVAAFFCVFAVLLNGTYPRVVFDFVAGTLRWQLRVNAWIFGLVDEYPPFKLED